MLDICDVQFKTEGCFIRDLLGLWIEVRPHFTTFEPSPILPTAFGGYAKNRNQTLGHFPWIFYRVCCKRSLTALKATQVERTG